MHPQHFGSNPVDIRIRIRINKKSGLESRVTFGRRFNLGCLQILYSLSALVLLLLYITCNTSVTRLEIGIYGIILSLVDCVHNHM